MPSAHKHRLNRFITHPYAILTLILSLIGVLWLVLVTEQERNRQTTYDAALNESANLTRAFEEHVVRTFHEVDVALQLLRGEWLADRARFDHQVKIVQAAFHRKLLMQISVIGADGRLAYTSLETAVQPLDLSDREHFRFHRDSSVDALFISKPVKGRLSGLFSIQATRPILSPVQGFQGVLVISLSPDYFSSFFRSVDLGQHGSISLIGTDGVFRARGSKFRMDEEVIGTRVPPGRPFLRVDAPAYGHFEVTSTIDGQRRLISYRKVDGYPLVVATTNAMVEILAKHRRQWSQLRLGALCVSLLMFIGALWLARALHTQHRFRRSLMEQKDRLSHVNESLRILNEIATVSSQGLDEKLNNALKLGCRHLGVEFGIVSHVVSDDYQLVSCVVPAAAELKKGDRFSLSTTYCSMTLASGDVFGISHMSSSEYAGHPCFQGFRLECYIGAPIIVRGMTYGTINFSSPAPYPGDFGESDLEFVRLLGRWAGSVIAEDESLTELKLLASTDFLTGVKNRGHFIAEAEREIRRARRCVSPLSLILIDLDHFKRINDTYGHTAGDDVLRAVATLCTGSLRASDLFARLGGEEFAVLLPDTPQEGALKVCEQLRSLIARSTIDALDNRLGVTISAGVAELAPGEDFKSMYNRADAALYKAKHLGRNRAVVSSPIG